MVRSRYTLVLSAVLFSGLGLLLGSGLFLLPSFFDDRILPRVSVAGIPVGGFTREAARKVLADHLRLPDVRLQFVQDAELWGIGTGTGVPVAQASPREAGVSADLERLLEAAYAVGRGQGGSWILERLALVPGVNIPALWQVDTGTLSAFLHRQFPHGFRDPVQAAWELEADGTFVYQPGQPGADVAIEEVRDALLERLASGKSDPIRLQGLERPVPASTVAGVETARVLSGPISLIADGDVHEVPTAIRAGWVVPETAASPPRLDRNAIERYVQSVAAPALARAPTEAQFEVSGNRATTFVPPEPGRKVLIAETAEGIVRGLAAGATNIKVVARPVPPQGAVSPLMEQYGIHALLARGESDYAGSPRNRIHNITVGARKYHGLLIPPGGEFSFNENLGPVDAAHGFLPELVILANVTTPQYGGGLCQVSTTMFRAAIHGGLPITARRNHAYAVSYYGTPGFDATIYPPNPDLRFRNDTSGHVLIQMKQEGTKLAFELWGTSDGREVEILGPYPFDRKPDGAVKARLVRKVVKAGDVQRDEWFSAYKSPKLFPKVLAANAERETWEERARRIAEKDQRVQEEFERKKLELERRSKALRKTGPPPSRPGPSPGEAKAAE